MIIILKDLKVDYYKVSGAPFNCKLNITKYNYNSHPT